ncbi:hypothetical protein TU94_05395 [Streptomyces cyaneogriseus subsp. noncyanogenus]|uniref:Lipoprotein n=1 Tax=Streptomyces cyaneogriseus subsp. noncyanogenus TaxID=477245 RepID=A0A0C5G6A8_9ACTN|nr:hypothetical protein [Streptomyces cyaneogriseus]AJP05533.1 hypothetical protein TU94_05395 [Streptomyces cyaneogriseus subsp. noncyanogenus]
MHRTTTTATLLLTVAVSALTGCVTLQRPPAPAPSATPTAPSAPRPDGAPEPRVVQAPAREALEMIGPSRPAAPSPAVSRRTPAPAAAPPRQPSAVRPEPRPRPARPEPREPAPPAPRRPRAASPGAANPAGRGGPGNAGVCSLGRTYGGWRADSPEAVICKRTYGR